MNGTTPTLSKFAQIYKERHQYAREWQERTKGRALGYFCTYTPEELIYAAGLLPVRILGSGEYPAESEIFMGPTWCAFSRDSLAEGLRGRYSYLSGIVYSNSCYHMMAAFDAWRRHVQTNFDFFLDLPWDTQATTAVAVVRREFARFRESLAKLVGHAITDDDVEGGIEAYNENRRLLHTLYELRKSPVPSITGAETLPVVVASQVMDKAEHSELMRHLAEELPDRQVAPRKLRLMLSGSEVNDVEIIKMIESVDALVVTDEQCMGTRYFWNEVPDGDDPLERLASRYMARPPCPFKDVRVPRRRLEQILTLARDYRVDGVVFLHQRFCEAHGWDIPYIQKALEKESIPSLALEVTIPNAMAPLRNRLEAFVETLTLDLT